MLLAIGILFVASVRADQFISFDEEEYQALVLTAYNKAARLNPVSAADGDQVRVWYMGYPSVHPTATGYIVTRDGVYRCRVKTDLTGEGIWVRSGQCGTRRRHRDRLAAALARFDEGSGFDGKSLSCPVYDGWEAYVEGIVGGKRFRFSAGNTDECAEKVGGDISQVNSWLDAMSGAYYKDDNDEG